MIDTNATSGGGIVPCQLQDRPIYNGVLLTLYGLTFCLSVTGNSMVIVTITQQRWMRTVTNLYLLNLAISDLLLSVICMPPTLLALLIQCFVFWSVMCKVFAFLQQAAVTASAYTLAVIAVERYYAICKPLHSRVWQTKSHALKVVTVIWAVALCANLTPVILYRTYELRPGQKNCGLVSWVTPVILFSHQLYLTVVIFLIPLSIMLVLYGLVIVELRRGMVTSSIYDDDESAEESVSNSRSLVRRVGRSVRSLPRRMRFVSERAGCKRRSEEGERARSPTTPRQPRAKPSHVSLRSTHAERAIVQKQRVILMLIVVVIVFFVCWTPLFGYFLLLTGAALYQVDLYRNALIACFTTLAYLSSCTNPITYCFLNAKFRQAFLIGIGCRERAGQLGRENARRDTEPAGAAASRPRLGVIREATADPPPARSRSVHATVCHSGRAVAIQQTDVELQPILAHRHQNASLSNHHPDHE